ncbi:hypothetical protein CAPTEDRAFT_188428 [Capitella teleta]|uniref:Acyltransferase 3 domain-containing protein n=1 Tax=Capitella teleta TaxID=283909 RepID=R7UK96_CAPTE|nr:hypothetical protein CAPTEDRAFT_188428 [Capitella teleta]|eukprot:ELU04228.1 hypothetical protein CAPTEDRAFT_188428 [Capitella teleta]
MWTSVQKNGGPTLFTSLTSWADLRCMGWSWYLANDFQFYVFSPAVMAPMYMWTIPDIVLLVLCMLGSFGSLVYTHTMVQQGEADWYIDFYIKPWCRYTPYAIGTLLDYIMFKTKCNVKMSKVVSVTIHECLVNTFLSWRFFIPLSHLTHINYLLHHLVLGFFQYNSHQMIYVNDTNVVLYAGGVMFYTLAM